MNMCILCRIQISGRPKYFVHIMFILKVYEYTYEIMHALYIHSQYQQLRSELEYTIMKWSPCI